jgi:hypothetical protein
MEQPRQHHYHFAYTVFPAELFRVAEPRALLGGYSYGFKAWVREVWSDVGRHVPPGEQVDDTGLAVTAHRIGGQHLTVLITMPPPQRGLETYFLAIVFAPEVRYFTLGRGVSMPGMSAALDRPTFREVRRDGTNANLGSGPTPTAEAFLQHLCSAFDLPKTVEPVSEATVRELAPADPADSRAPDAPKPTKRWWEFWK